jgi:hypothetical protein
MGYGLRATGYRLPATGYRLLATGYGLRAMGYGLWDYGMVWACEIMSLTSNSSFSLDSRTPMEQLTGKTPDISEYLDFGFYD